MLSQAACNWNTSLGAACFLACALDTLITDEVSKMPGVRRLGELEHELDRDIRRVIRRRECQPHDRDRARRTHQRVGEWSIGSLATAGAHP